MKVDAPCPECGHSPVDVLNMLDGSVWICPSCGYQEYGDPPVDAPSEHRQGSTDTEQPPEQ